MRTDKSFCFFALMALITLLTACAKAPVASADLGHVERSACVARFKNKGPTLCIPPNGVEALVVGLPLQHGFQHGDWARIETQVAGHDQPVARAMAAVTDTFEGGAVVRILHQTDAEDLDGASVRRIPQGEPARFGKFVGRVVRSDLGILRINIGRDDGVVPGDVYQVLLEPAQPPIGRIRIARVEPGSAWAIPLDLRSRRYIGLDVVLLQAASTEVTPLLDIVVIPFTPIGSASEEENRMGYALAEDLATSLQRAVGDVESIHVTFSAGAHADPTGDKEGQDPVRRIGQQLGADIIVWGTIRCPKRACAMPMYTILNDTLRRGRPHPGGDIWLDRSSERVFSGESLKDLRALAMGLLGNLAYETQRYPDALFYLQEAVDGLREKDALWVRERLIYTLYVLGQTVAARQRAEELRARAVAESDEEARLVAVGELARLDLLQGRKEVASRHLTDMLNGALASHDNASVAFALHHRGTLELDQGDIQKARATLSSARDAFRLVGDHQGESASLHYLAVLEATSGNVEGAYELQAEVLGIGRRLPDAQTEAGALHELARLHHHQGHLEKARELYTEALAIWIEIMAIQEEAATLHELGRLLVQLGRLEEAYELALKEVGIGIRLGGPKGLAEARSQLVTVLVRLGRETEAREVLAETLAAFRRIPDLRGIAASLHNLAHMEILAGRFDAARPRLQEAIYTWRKLDQPANEAASVHELGFLEERQGQNGQARALYELALQSRQRAQDVDGELRTMIRLSVLDYKQGLHSAAQRRLEATLASSRRLHLREHEAASLRWLGMLDKDRGQWDPALARFREALIVYQTLKRTEEVEQLLREIERVSPLSKRRQGVAP